MHVALLFPGVLDISRGLGVSWNDFSLHRIGMIRKRNLFEIFLNRSLFRTIHSQDRGIHRVDFDSVELDGEKDKVLWYLGGGGGRTGAAISALFASKYCCSGAEDCFWGGFGTDVDEIFSVGMRSVGISFAGVSEVSSSSDLLLLFFEVKPEDCIVLFLEDEESWEKSWSYSEGGREWLKWSSIFAVVEVSCRLWVSLWIDINAGGGFWELFIL